jgi:peptide/nickel transport system permease protein
VLLFVPTLIGAAFGIFVLMRVIPGDPALVLLSGEGNVVDQNALAALRHKLGTDRPLLVQLGLYYTKIAKGDFGSSLFNGAPVLPEILRRFPLDLEVTILAVMLMILIGIPGGLISAKYQDSWPDYLLRVISIGGLATPSFWLAIVVIVGLVAFFNWLPPIQYYQVWEQPWENLQQMLLPALIVGYRSSAVILRMTRATMIEIVREDYVRTARAKGLAEVLVLRRHALKNALLPVVTLLGTEFGLAFGGLVVTETVFNLPGIALLFVESVFRRDLPVVQATVLFIAFGVLVINLLVDLMYAWLDPRIRYS